MALAFNASTNSGEQSSSPVTLAHTVAGTDNVLCVAVCARASGDNDSNIVTSATYNGVAMTKVLEKNFVAGRPTVAWFRLDDPATGLHNVVVTMASGAAYQVTAVSYQGAADGTDASASATGTGTNASTSVTTVADNAIVLSALMTGGNNTSTIQSSHTEITATDFGASVGRLAIGRLPTAKTPAGSVTMGWTLGVSQDYTIALLSIAPVGAVSETLWSQSCM